MGHIANKIADIFRANEKARYVLWNIYFWYFLGTRWAQELVWCLRNSIEEAKNGLVDARVPFFEWVV